MLLACPAATEELAPNGCTSLAPFLHGGLCHEECPADTVVDPELFTCEAAAPNGCPASEPFRACQGDDDELVPCPPDLTDLEATTCVGACPANTVGSGPDALCSCDLDGDDWCAPDDCAPMDPAIHPDAIDLCDGVDGDCNGVVDDGAGCGDTGGSTDDTGGDDTGSTDTSGSTDVGDGSSDGTDTGAPANGYGDCVNNPERRACLADEFCFGGPDVPGFCTDACSDAAECLVPSTGDAPPACALFGPGGGLCYLDCAAGQSCPDGMTCETGICVWMPEGVTVPKAWTCALEAYDAGDGCDCGCGVIDPDCANGGVASCDTCDGQGSCSAAACPGTIALKDNASCI